MARGSVHSDYAFFKLNERFDYNTSQIVIKSFKNKNYFNDDLYLSKLLSLCQKRHYGIYRFNKMLKDKHNKEGYDLYTYSMEKEVINDIIPILFTKYKKYEYDKKYSKIYNKLIYNGFTKVNILKVL